MYTKIYKGKIVGKKTFTNKTSDGREYESKYYNVVYKSEANYIEGYNVKSIKSNLDLTAGEYEIKTCIVKYGDKLYEEIIDAKPIESK